MTAMWNVVHGDRMIEISRSRTSHPARHVPLRKGVINAYHTRAKTKNKWVRAR